MVNHTKIAVIGAGSVGAAIVSAIMFKKVAAEILLQDIDEKKCEGEVLDLSDAAFQTGTKVKKATPQECGQADIIIVSAGAKQRPEETRVQLIDRNHKILTAVINGMKPLNPHAILLLVANPVDILTYFAQKISGLPKGQVFGSGTFLDTNRLRNLISERLQIAESAIHAYILGEHGDSQFAAWSSARIAGIPITEFKIKQEELDQMAEHAKKKAYKIINMKGATYFGIGSVVSSICESIVLNQRVVRPVSTYIDNLGVCISMPTIIGSKGVEEVLPTPLNEKEQQQMNESASALKKIIEEYEK